MIQEIEKLLDSGQVTVTVTKFNGTCHFAMNVADDKVRAPIILKGETLAEINGLLPAATAEFIAKLAEEKKKPAAKPKPEKKPAAKPKPEKKPAPKKPEEQEELKFPETPQSQEPPKPDEFDFGF